MGRRKKVKYTDLYASNKSTDSFGTIFDSMCKSQKYMSLTIGARQFYTLCRVQARSKIGRECLYNHGNEFKTEYNCEREFVFPTKHLAAYGILRQNANRYFKELEKAGFIEKAEQNNHTRKVNVYRFSDKWKC